MHSTGASVHSSLTSRRWSKTLPIPQNRYTPKIIHRIRANKLPEGCKANFNTPYLKSLG